MNEREIIDKISSYMDNEIDKEQLKSIDEHLVDCPVCQEELKLLKQVDSAVKELPAYSLSPQFSEKLMRQVEKEAALTEKDNFKIFLHPFKFFEEFYKLINFQQVSKTATLEELGDFPPCSIGYVYFKILATKQRG